MGQQSILQRLSMDFMDTMDLMKSERRWKRIIALEKAYAEKRKGANIDLNHWTLIEKFFYYFGNLQSCEKYRAMSKKEVQLPERPFSVSNRRYLQIALIEPLPFV